ncbi:MAG: hypothetical protein QXL14_02125 [Candidatus Aenigmatarchaeota archaeon]
MVDLVKKKLIGVKYYNYRFYLHLIYRPIERATWRIPSKYNTLAQFMRLAESRGYYQKRNDHPLVLEFVLTFPSDRELSDKEIERVLNFIDEILSSLGFAWIMNYSEVGYDYEVSDTPIDFQCYVWWSRDGRSVSGRMDLKRYAMYVLRGLYV